MERKTISTDFINFWWFYLFNARRREIKINQWFCMVYLSIDTSWHYVSTWAVYQFFPNFPGLKLFNIQSNELKIKWKSFTKIRNWSTLIITSIEWVKSCYKKWMCTYLIPPISQNNIFMNTMTEENKKIYSLKKFIRINSDIPSWSS